MSLFPITCPGMVAAEYVGGAGANPSGGTITFTADAISGMSSDSLALLFVFDSDSGQTIATPSGWTLIDQSAGATISWGIWRKTGADVSASISMADDDGVALMLGFDGVSYSAYDSDFDSTNGPDIPSLGSFVVGDISLVVGANRSNNSMSISSGYTAGATQTNSTATAAQIKSGYSVAASAGTISPANFTNMGTPSIGWHVRLAKVG